MLGTTYVGTEMLAIGLFTVCLSKFYHLKHVLVLFSLTFYFEIN